jgi:hypothetical protein
MVASKVFQFYAIVTHLKLEGKSESRGPGAGQPRLNMESLLAFKF